MSARESLRRYSRDVEKQKLTITIQGQCATGKTTIAAEIEAALSKLGFNVRNADYDIVAGCNYPELQSQRLEALRERNLEIIINCVQLNKEAILRENSQENVDPRKMSLSPNRLMQNDIISYDNGATWFEVDHIEPTQHSTVLIHFEDNTILEISKDTKVLVAI